MNIFDGQKETVHLDHGKAFGIPLEIYQCLSQACISASKYGGIEPVLLEHWEDRRPGVICLLFGKEWSFSIFIDCSRIPPGVGLTKVSLDDSGSRGEMMIYGQANRFDTWRLLVRRMLETEGVKGHETCPSSRSARH